MHWNENIERLLNATTKAVEALVEMVECEELTHNIDKQIDIIWSVMETEAEVAEYIDNFSFAEVNLQAVKSSKEKFIEINQKILMHIQKKQLHGYNLEGIRNTVQLEIETLRKETSLM